MPPEFGIGGFGVWASRASRASRMGRTGRTGSGESFIIQDKSDKNALLGNKTVLVASTLLDFYISKDILERWTRRLNAEDIG